MMKPFEFLSALGTSLLILVFGSNSLYAQNSERWFQIEMSVFTNEEPGDRDAEYWTPGRQPLSYPGAMQRLRELMDLLAVDDLLPQDDSLPGTADTVVDDSTAVQTMEDYIRATGPLPAGQANGFKFLDFARDPLLRLPTSTSNLQQTNRALEQSAEHRLLYTASWRQPVLGTADAVPLYVSGGQMYGGTPELQGSVTVRFNASADRVVIDADLWLSEFSLVADDTAIWELPAVPPRVLREYEQVSSDDGLDYRIRRIYQLKQSRDMRSAEFHYLDHPALGVVITAEPYEVPPVEPESTESTENIESTETEPLL